MSDEKPSSSMEVAMILMRFLGCSGTQLDESSEYAQIPFSSATLPE